MSSQTNVNMHSIPDGKKLEPQKLEMLCLALKSSIMASIVTRTSQTWTGIATTKPLDVPKQNNNADRESFSYPRSKILAI